MRYERNASGGTTDHALEIALLRMRADEMARTHDPHSCGPEIAFQITGLVAAAALLEVHDDSGISLDDWVGPAELVNVALHSIGQPPFLPNGV